MRDMITCAEPVRIELSGAIEEDFLRRPSRGREFDREFWKPRTQTPKEVPFAAKLFSKKDALRGTQVVFYGGELTFTPAPAALENFQETIRGYRSILELPADWDDDGAPSFTALHFDRIERFLINAFQSIYARYRVELESPTLSPVPDGSIDVHWKTDRAELLVNVPSDQGQVSFYGDDFGARKAKGTMLLTDEDFPLLVWLKLAK